MNRTAAGIIAAGIGLLLALAIPAIAGDFMGSAVKVLGPNEIFTNTHLNVHEPAYISAVMFQRDTIISDTGFVYVVQGAVATRVGRELITATNDEAWLPVSKIWLTLSNAVIAYTTGSATCTVTIQKAK